MTARLSRRHARTLVAVLAALSLLAACGSGGGDPAPGDAGAGAGQEDDLERVTFRLDWVINGSNGIFFAALEQGYFADEGLHVEILEGAGSGLALQQVGNKDDDFGFADFGAMVQARAEELPAVMVANIFRRAPHVVLSLESTGITSPEDLVGKRVGGAPGSSPTTLFPAYLNANGVDEADVEFVTLDPAAYLPALYEGQVDAVVGFSTAQYVTMQLSAPEPPAVQYYADWGIVSVSSGIIVHPDTLAERPEVVGAFVRAIQRGLEWSRDNPEASAAMLASRFPRSIPEEEALAALEADMAVLHSDRTQDAPIGYLHPDDATDTLETLAQFGGLEEILPHEEYYTNEFVEE